MTDTRALAHECGAVSYTPGAMRAVRGVSFTFEQLEAFADRLRAPQPNLAPGLMRCAKCKFKLIRATLNVNVGTVTAGDSKTEPCPNGCGPLWPVTWEEEAREAYATAEAMFERADAAEKALAAASPAAPQGGGGADAPAQVTGAAEQKPVAWRYHTEGNPTKWHYSDTESLLGLYQPLYAAPAEAPANEGGIDMQRFVDAVKDGIADHLADNLPDRKHALSEIEAAVRSVEVNAKLLIERRGLAAPAGAPANEGVSDEDLRAAACRVLTSGARFPIIFGTVPVGAELNPFAVEFGRAAIALAAPAQGDAKVLADAKRYRWLRAAPGPELKYGNEQYTRVCSVCHHYGDDLDAAIDDAIDAAPTGGDAKVLADAERYRWLRDVAEPNRSGERPWATVRDKKGHAWAAGFSLDGAIDEAIRAARQSKTQGGQQ